jgi:hypothetical protein
VRVCARARGCVFGAAVHLDLAQWQYYRPTLRVVNTVKRVSVNPSRYVKLTSYVMFLRGPAPLTA